MPDSKSTKPDAAELERLFSEITSIAYVCVNLLQQDGDPSSEAQAVKFLAQQIGALADHGLTVSGGVKVMGSPGEWIGIGRGRGSAEVQA